jgi:hypothetical protein
MIAVKFIKKNKGLIYAMHSNGHYQQVDFLINDTGGEVQ